jgi:hypothetical protein
MFRRIVRIAGAVCASLVLGAAAPVRPPARSEFVIRNVRIFDGERVIEANSVAVADGKIIGVGTNLASSPDAQVVNGSGDTLLPGLIDSHVHAWNRDVLEMGLVMGVTTELDMYMRWEEALEWRAEESKGAADIADFRTAWTAIAVAGGHGTEADLPPMIPISRPNEAQAFVDERIAHGFRLHQSYVRQRAALRRNVKGDSSGNREGGSLAPQNGDSPCRLSTGLS